VRSLAFLLTRYQDVKQYFIAPPPLQIKDDILDLLRAARIEFEIGSDFEKVIPRPTPFT